jgi:Sec-independent protein secretion pathway component TatC
MPGVSRFESRFSRAFRDFSRSLGSARRCASLVISIVVAVLTPTPDVFNMMLMVVPLNVLFEVGSLGMRL